MFLYLSVILFHRGGGCLSQCMLGYTPSPGADIPPELTLPPGADTPQGQTSPTQQTATAVDGTHPTGMHSCHANFHKHVSRILSTVGLYPSMKWAGGVYPRMQWAGDVCLGMCTPRDPKEDTPRDDASYWNAFLS